MEDTFDQLSDLSVAKALADFIDHKYGVDTVILDLRQQGSFTDFFVITTTRSEVHQKGLIEALTEFAVKSYRMQPQHTVKKGTVTGGWAILDYRSIVIHVFSAEQRKFYDLEKVWFEASRVSREVSKKQA